MKNWTVDMRAGDIVVALLLLCLSLLAIYSTTTWLPPNLPGDPGAAFFPRISLGVMIFFSAVLLIQNIRPSPPADDSPDTASGEKITVDLRKFLLTIISSGLLVAGIAYLGFELAAFVFLFFILGQRTNRWIWALITSVIAVGIMYFVFVIILNVRLPLLFLPSYLNIF